MCFLPFPTLLMNRYQNHVFPTIFYAATVAAIGLMMNVLWWYAAAGNRLLRDDIHPKQARQTTMRMFIPPALFLASIPFAFYNSTLPQLIWMLAMFVRPKMHRHRTS
jgi:uncharacterized membrane protein